MTRRLGWLAAAVALTAAGIVTYRTAENVPSRVPSGPLPPSSPRRWAGRSGTRLRLIREGRQTFRYDTFGDEAFLGRRPHCTRPSPARSSAASAPA